MGGSPGARALLSGDVTMRQPVLKVAIALGGLLLLTGAGAVLMDRHATATATDGCNGHVELCDRPYDQVAFPATHNSMTAADDGWSLPEQPDGILSQLQAGIRVFLIDSWYGQATSHAGVVATTEASRSKAQAELTADLGGEVVAAALRARGADALTRRGWRVPTSATRAASSGRCCGRRRWRRSGSGW